MSYPVCCYFLLLLENYSYPPRYKTKEGREINKYKILYTKKGVNNEGEKKSRVAEGGGSSEEKGKGGSGREEISKRERREGRMKGGSEW